MSQTCKATPEFNLLCHTAVDHEAERERVKKAMAELKKKAERAERAQRKAEVAAAELRGKTEAEKESVAETFVFLLPHNFKRRCRLCRQHWVHSAVFLAARLCCVQTGPSLLHPFSHGRRQTALAVEAIPTPECST
eukprot:scaffold116213_cov38-Prasinocladus_malaysianus.AAC.2